MRTITSVCLLLGFGLLAEAQQPVRYIVELRSTPVFAFHHRLLSEAAAPASATSRAASAASTLRRPTPAEEAYALSVVKREQADFDARAAALGFRSTRHLAHVTNVVVVEGTPGSEQTLRALPGVKRVARERVYHSNFDASIALHQIDSAWSAIPGATYNPSNPAGWNVAGKGVKIGIVDTGIDATHPAFAQPSMLAQMTLPAGFPKWSDPFSTSAATANQALTNNKLIVVRSYGGQGAQDIDGHGTAVAQVAAGFPIPSGVYNSSLASPNNMTLSGVAPAAWLGIYDIDSSLNGSYSDTDILTALDDAGTDGMDVVSMSFGSPDYGGSADPLNQTYNEAFNTLRNLGVVLVASAGNDGPDSNSVAAPGVDPGVIAVGAQQSTSLLGDASVTLSITTYDAMAADNNTSLIPALTAPLADIRSWDSTGLGCTNAPTWPQAGVAAGKLLLVQRGNCNFTDKVQNAATAGAAGIIVFNAAVPSDGSSPDSLVVMLLDSATNPSAIANLPSIFVGYNNGLALRTAAATSTSVKAVFGLTAGDPHQVADFSGRGPNADLAIKPEIVASGNSIITAYCTDTSLYPSYNRCSPFGYLFWDGTSFGAPLVAGSVAVTKSARPNLSSDDYRSLVVNAASPMLDAGGNTWAIQTAGAGSLNAARGVSSTVSVNPVTLSFGVAGSAIPTSQPLKLTNIGTSTNNYNLTFEATSVPMPAIPVVPVSASWGWGTVTVLFPAYNQLPSFYTNLLPVTPDLSFNAVSLARGATATVTVTMPTSGLTAGTYQGFIDVTPIGSSTPHARVPYWYAVPASAPNQIAFDVSPLYITAGTTQSMIMRFVDNSGVVFPAPGTVQVTQTSGAAGLSSPYQAYSGTVTFPNVWLVDITVPASAVFDTEYNFHVVAGNVSGDFTVITQ